MSQPPAYPGEEVKYSAPPPTGDYYPKQAQMLPQQPEQPQQPYPQPGTVYYYPGQAPAYGPPGPQPYICGQPQQPSIVMVGGQSSQSYAGHIAFAVCSFCCCGVFGLIALILAGRHYQQHTCMSLVSPFNVGTKILMLLFQH